MTNEPNVETVEAGDDYYHVRFRDPDDFDDIRTPDWAQNAAESVSEGAEVRMGKQGDDWAVQSVLVKKSVGEEKAVEQAEKILDEIAS
ncbi:hypothetical protein C474_15949 [Halogeometricum pallidum JCM 14848]|uniref:Uncharacterized protein n=1 Tax=Halogeometricum pallidum JCM 14848 TaxID=1227487 RepID=M0D1K4_HALPD|nr:hypothetical protein [Halogeometricum pallidum]ELZ28009.1 hypothetical protein C474_15949 [Halogeometricum pallidum JCM 14848]